MRRIGNRESNLPNSELALIAKEVLRVLQLNQRILAFELKVSQTTVSGYFTKKTRINGWSSFERKLTLWIINQNMDGVLTTEPSADTDLIKTVEYCKQLQSFLKQQKNAGQFGSGDQAGNFGVPSVVVTKNSNNVPTQCHNERTCLLTVTGGYPEQTWASCGGVSDPFSLADDDAQTTEIMEYYSNLGFDFSFIHPTASFADY